MRIRAYAMHHILIVVECVRMTTGAVWGVVAAMIGLIGETG